MPAVPCHLNLKPNVCAICAVALVLELTVCAICAVSFVCGPTVCAICVVCAPNVCAACAVCVGNRLGQLSVARLHVSARRAEIPANINCCCYDCCGSLNVDMVFLWAVVDVFVGQPQTVAPQRYQQRPTQTSTANTTAAATTAAFT